ncbi:MAG: DUF1592 domain-containing protein [Oligoflexus sp.]|nr:DUF1592 domain-containing protein [Oligoflexus sp.]
MHLKIKTWLPPVLLLLVSCSKAPEKYSRSNSRSATEAGKDSYKNIPKGIDTDGDGVIDQASPVTALAFLTAFPRITHIQWENSVKDILLLSKVPGLAASFTTDPSGSFFKSDGNLLKTTPSLWADYQNAAETVAKKVAADAAQVAKLVPAAAPASGDARALAIVGAIAKRAFRRPVSEAQMTRLIALYNKGPALTGTADPTAGGLQVVITAILQSPNFLYRTELGADKSALVKLNGWEIASRLSFATWNTIPDEALLKAAESGELLTPEGLKKQVQRLVDDPRANPTLMDFYQRLFETASYAFVKKDAKALGYWPDNMGKALLTEADLFIKDVVIDQRGGINQILTAPYAFVNSKTAPIYGVTASMGETFEKVELNPSQRSGLLTQVGFLATRAKEKESDPIHRGVVVATNILCAELKAPPGTFPPLPAELPGQTTRMRVEAHTGKGTCGSSCHGSVINPAGYAFENFDAAGKWRTIDNTLPVNASAEFRFPASSISYAGPVEFIKKIAERDELHRCYIQKAVELMYARQVDPQDESLIAVLSKKSAADLSTRDLFIQLLTDSRISYRGNAKGN